MATKRTLLIVEDDRELNEQSRDLCRMALDELALEGLSIIDTIQQAFDYESAKQFLLKAAVPIDFVSFDLALTREEENLTGDTGRLGGIRLLRQLRGSDHHPISIILSGEPRQPYPLDILQSYGVLNFYQKEYLDIEQYISAVKAAMWCLQAESVFEVNQIHQAKLMYERAKEAAEKAGNTQWNRLHHLKQRLSPFPLPSETVTK